MQSIYQRAKRVVIWLGESSNDSDLAITLLEKLGGRQKVISTCPEFSDYGEWYGPQFKPWPGIEGEKAAEIFRKVRTKVLNRFDLMGPEDIDKVGWNAMKDFLMSRDYWKRVLVIQEITYA
jgi:Heterokaryon incompatibility protein (HET)